MGVNNGSQTRRGLLYFLGEGGRALEESDALFGHIQEVRIHSKATIK